MTEPKKKRHTARWVIIGIILAGIAVFAVACIATISNSVDEVTRDVDITYMVTGTAKQVSVDYVTDSQLAQSQEDPVTVPWTKKLKLPSGVASLEAQNKGPTGNVTCKIFVNGKLQSQHTSTGAYVVVTC